MGKETVPSRTKLKAAVAQDYPAAGEILLSFPETWELVQVLRTADQATPIYVGAFPAGAEKSGRDHFAGLSPEINLSLTSYRLYKFFQPWVMPTVLVDWNFKQGQGRVSGYGDSKVSLQPLGQAQVWSGNEAGVMWECYFNESRRTSLTWKETLAAVWQIVEKDIAVSKIFTAPHEPEFVEGYRDFLSTLNYTQDREHPLWWSKTISSPKT